MLSWLYKLLDKELHYITQDFALLVQRLENLAARKQASADVAAEIAAKAQADAAKHQADAAQALATAESIRAVFKL